MTDTAQDTLAPQLKVDGQLMGADWLAALVDLRVELEMRLPGRCTLRFVDHGYALIKTGQLKLGSALVVSVYGTGDQLFAGEVTGFSVDQEMGSAPELVVVAHDRSHRMSRGSRVSTYLKMSYSDVVSKLASEHGLQAKVTTTSTRLEYLMQADSDMALLTAMADRVGYDWWVDGTTLNFSPPKPNQGLVTQTMGTDILALSVRTNGQYADKVKVTGWDRRSQQVITSVSPIGGSQLRATSPFADLVKTPQGAFGSTQMETAAGGVVAQGEAQELSNALRDRAVAASVTARGTVYGNGAIKLGTTVKIDDAGPLSGNYHVTRVDHTYRADAGFRTRFMAGERAPTSLVDTLGGGGNGGRGAGSFMHPGLVVGEVTNINDPNNAGRVKVRYPALSGQDESAWARMVAMGGGKGRGQVFLPEVGDEVLLGFEAGDLRQPVVLGGLYGDKATIPATQVQNGQLMARRMTSRLGHVMEMGDGTAPAAQHVMLQLAGEQHKFRLGKDQVDLNVPAGTPVNIVAGSTKVAFGKDGAITIEGANITIKATQKLSLQGMAIEVKGTTQVAVDGGPSTTIKGAATSVEGNGSLTLKGGMVMIN